MSHRNAQYAARALAIAVLVSLPVWIGNSYYINIASQILIWAVLALALNLLVGLANALILRRKDLRNGDYHILLQKA